MSDNNKLVSVVLLGEALQLSQIEHYLKTITTEQTYQNLEILVVTVPRNDMEELADKEEWKNHKIPIRFLEANGGIDLIAMGCESAMGDYVFYKTCGAAAWYPHHIERHLEILEAKNIEWCISQIERRDQKRPQELLNVLGWRIENPPKIEDLLIDEISHAHTLKPTWEDVLVRKGEQEIIVPGMLLKSWTENKINGGMADEITVVQWLDANAGQPKAIYQLAKTADQVIENVNEESSELEMTKIFPTVVGNLELQDHNKAVWNAIGDYQPKTIAVKRTIGMGDVIQTEPILSALKAKYPDSKLTFFTSQSRSCQAVAEYFGSVDEVIGIPEQSLTQDILNATPPSNEEVVEIDGEMRVEKKEAWKTSEINIDLDLAYESRQDSSFIGGYAEVAGMNEQDLSKPSLTFESETPTAVSGNYIVLCNEGSGWAGKEWNPESWKALGITLQKLGYQLVETAQNPNYHLFENSIKTDGSMEQFLQYCQHASAYVGADNGVMHVCATFNVPCFVVAGAAVPSKTYPNGDIFEVTADNEFVGCKHKFFYRTDGPAFVPPNQERCFEGLTDEYVGAQLQEFIKVKKL